MEYLVIHQAGSDTIVTRFRKQRSKLLFAGAMCQPLINGQNLAGQQPELGDQTGEASRIILALPPGGLFFRELTLPLVDRRKLREIIPLELKGEIALDTDDLLFDSIILEEGKVLAAWVRSSAILEDIEQLSGQNLEPEFVTCSLFAWNRIIPAEAVDDKFTAISDGDAIAVFRGGVAVFFRSLTGEDRTAEIARTLSALEIGRGIRIERFYIHGALVRQGCDDLPSAELLPISDTQLDAFAGDVSLAREMAGAFAMAATCCFGEPVNFRSGTLTYTRERDKLRKKLRLTAILAVVFVVLLFAHVGLRYYLISKDLGSLNSSVKTIYREVFPDRKKAVDEVGELRAEIKRLGTGTSSGSVLLILKRLADAKTDDITGIFETDIDGDLVRLKGDARSIQAVNDFKAKAASAFSGAEVSEIKSRADGTVSFQFKGTLKGEGK
ncbi:MAG: type II secretion system protein GspL [Deltaproteobacteria bacterium]|nr:type II secretion system protein GspL [Deltaproteobacteria bacterium]